MEALRRSILAMRPESYLPLGERGVMTAPVDAAKPGRLTTVTSTPTGGAPVGLGHPGVTVDGSDVISAPVVQSGVTAWTTVFVTRYTSTDTWVLVSNRVGAAPGHSMGRGRALTLAGTSGRLWVGLEADFLFHGIETVKLYNDGRPHLVVGTFFRLSGAIGSGDYEMWVDGVKDNGAVANVGGGSAPTNNSNPIRLQASIATDVSHLACFKRVLSRAEILALWTAARVSLPFAMAD